MPGKGPSSDTARETKPAPWAPLLAVVALGALATTPRVESHVVLSRSVLATCIGLLLWHGALFVRSRRGGPTLRLESAFRPQHYVQALVQLAVFAYWGWYWRPVYDMAVLIGAQLIFAYAFGMLLSWTRGRRYVLGFGPFPIVFSINLFLWFRDDWFYLQFLMIAVGLLGKEFVRWHRDGRQVHIFNPSAFSLGLFSLVLIATGTTDLTWGADIASTLTLAPNIYLFLFGVGLVVMYFFSITLLAGAAATVLFVLSALYYTWSGVPYFVDSEIPAAVFLGLHLLITDPSTSPRSTTGKVVFGGLYGTGVFALYAILGAAGAPTFYDKLLCVPLLNLAVRGIDHAVTKFGERRVQSVARGPVHPTRLNLAHMAGWIVFFGVMTATGRTDGRHEGDRIPFWEQACSEDRRTSCDRLIAIEANYCADNSAWACNELGLHHAEGRIVGIDPQLASGYFSSACELRFQVACLNLLDPENRQRAEPRELDLRLLLREGGLNLMQMEESVLYARACEHGWDFACPSTDRAS
ncbi:MAG: hypothetical protein O2958_14790 [Gemmatimonadetes bacterium]|nr:hypothetical protein [Gemmatimonadota bacterium]MDA1102979.1 hypothetical protein [Gemmatimonadota bacterium]